MKLFACYCKITLVTAKLADWVSCPLLGEPVTCVDATCTQKCPHGTVPSGSRRTRCRWNRQKGFRWGRQLGPCVGCQPLELRNSGLITTTTNTKRLTLHCSNNDLVNGHKSILLKCLCPRVDGVRKCSWRENDSKLSALREFSCGPSELSRLSMTRRTSLLQVQLNQFCMENSADCGSAQQQLKYARFSRDQWHCYKEVANNHDSQCIDNNGILVKCFAGDETNDNCNLHNRLNRLIAETVRTVKPIVAGLVQKEMNQWCVNLSRQNSACDKVKFARFTAFQWRCVADVYARASLDCVGDAGEQRLCRAANTTSQTCTRHDELAHYVPTPPPPRSPTKFLTDCLATYTAYNDAGDYVASAVEMCTTIDLMNKWRRQYQVPEFEVPNKQLCDDAQAWSLKMAREMRLSRTVGGDQGENVAAGYAHLTTLRGVVELWQAEGRWWDHEKMAAVDSPRKTNADCFHFTQNMWRSTRQVCLAIAVNTRTNVAFVTGRYWPRGNVDGQWHANLFPPVETNTDLEEES